VPAYLDNGKEAVKQLSTHDNNRDGVW